jgi:hypothetical protein
MTKSRVTFSGKARRVFWAFVGTVLVVAYLPRVIYHSQRLSLIETPTVSGVRVQMKEGWVIVDCPFWVSRVSTAIADESDCLAIAHTKWYRFGARNVTIVGSLERTSSSYRAHLVERTYPWGRALVLPPSAPGGIGGEWIYFPDFRLSAYSNNLEFLDGVQSVVAAAP